MLNALIVRGVPSRQFEAVRQSDGCDHRIAAADRPSDAIQVTGDLARQVSGGLVEQDNLLRRDGVAEGLNTARPSDPLLPLDDFHYRNHREGEKAISLPVGGCVTGDGLVDAFAYF